MTYPQQPGHQGGEPPTRVPGVIIAITIIAVLVLGGGGVTLWVLNKDDRPVNSASDPTTEDRPADNPFSEAPPTDSIEAAVTAIAQEYADAINDEDPVAATESTCDQARPGTLYTAIAGRAEVDIASLDILGEGVATVDFVPRDAGDQPIQLYFELRGNAWCITV
jgi:hypothetical protein